MSWSFPWNRYTITLGAILLMVSLWNLYVALNADGIITGWVVGPDNRPVEGATVVLSERTLLVSAVRARTMTAANGAFRFSGHRLYHLYVEAFREGVGRMPPREYRLYFKGQNLSLRHPLRLEPVK
jgi:hypothetical protein